MVGIVIVSHSAQLAGGVVDLARQMSGPDVAIVAAGGMDLPDSPLGTDAVLVARAVDEAWGEDGVLVLMDLGSAVLSAEMATEMLPDDRRSRVLLCEAPLVEGAVAAAVAARLGEPLERVAAEARGGLAGKAAALGGPATGQPEAAVQDAGPAALEARIAVRNPLGLHARPAARFVQAVGRFDAEVTAENLTIPAGPASARSLNGVATLGVRQGHEILVRASGPQAQDVLAALRALAAEDFGEPPGTAPPGTAPPQAGLARPAVPGPGSGAAAAQPPGPGTVLTGLAASAGLAAGPARHLRQQVPPVPRDPAADPAAELARLDEAVAAVRREVTAARDAVAGRTHGGYEAEIFEAHLLFLQDEALLGPARKLIAGGRNAADAWDCALAAVLADWQGLADEYQRARAADVQAIRSQVLGHLLGAPRAAVTGSGVLVAEDLTPAQTAGLDPAVVRGIATAHGGPTAHAAILARALGIPAVVGLGAALLAVPEGTTLLLDGERGTAQVAPSPDDVTAAEQAARRRAAAGDQARQRAAEPAVTADGMTVEVAANAGSADDVRQAVAAGADGIGLLRTEFVFLGSADMPTEREQEAVYREIAQVLAGRPLIVRTLDVGADKPLAYLPRDPEPNPALGERGIRLGLARPELLLPQIRAVALVAADYPVKLMFPMVATRTEVDAALALVAQATAGLPGEGAGLEVGIMVEVPAAALSAPALADSVSFFSVGTNDLAQYTLAADRAAAAAAVAGLADALHPAVLALIGQAAAAATAAGRWTGVCGEVAADPLAVPVLLGLGVRELSVSARSVPAVKQAVRGVRLDAARELAAQAVRLPSAAAVRDLVRQRHVGVPC
ncbi:MAG: phosphoenolpyruvate--protein phosphotransferase [Streptosporangiaceae bacterium]